MGSRYGEKALYYRKWHSATGGFSDVSSLEQRAESLVHAGYRQYRRDR